jgi:murein endopeptidase
LKNTTLFDSAKFLTCAIAAAFIFAGSARAELNDNDLLPSSPSSDYLEILDDGADLAFCAKWNPEFVIRGHHCCPKNVKRKRRGKWCAPSRAKSSFCSEMTEEQKLYFEDASSGKLGDILSLLQVEAGKSGNQAYCSVNNGFLAFGRMLVPSAKNRVKIRNPGRCTDFGTDAMIGMIESVGRQIDAQYKAPEYAGVSLLVGDISAPRGGCLGSGRKGHASHTSGQDVDLAFLSVKAGGKSPATFVKDFDAKANWWLVKQIFQNPFACIKVIFLDRRLINKLAKAAHGDPLWGEYHKFIRHVKFHRNHFHVRIGDHSGQPGCGPGAHPELEAEEENADESEANEFLQSFISDTIEGPSPSSPAR